MGQVEGVVGPDGDDRKGGGDLPEKIQGARCLTPVMGDLKEGGLDIISCPYQIFLRFSFYVSGEEDPPALPADAYNQ